MNEEETPKVEERIQTSIDHFYDSISDVKLFLKEIIRVNTILLKHFRDLNYRIQMDIKEQYDIEIHDAIIKHKSKNFSDNPKDWKKKNYLSIDEMIVYYNTLPEILNHISTGLLFDCYSKFKPIEGFLIELKL